MSEMASATGEMGELPRPAATSRQELRGLARTSVETTSGTASAVVTMGLTGAIAQVANLSAVALVCVMFFMEREESRAVAREDRALFRDTVQQIGMDSRNAIEQLRRDSDRQWQAIKKNTEATEKLTEVTRHLAEKMRPREDDD